MSLKLKIDIVESHNPGILAIVDISDYSTTPINNPSLEITPPGFNKVPLIFVPQQVNTYTTVDLGLSSEEVSFPDGIYTIKYSIFPNATNYIERKIMRVDNLVCMYQKSLLDSISSCDCEDADKFPYEVYLLIQGSIAAVNECNDGLAVKLYEKAYKLLGNNNNCGCK